jgi:hypothetical protein
VGEDYRGPPIVERAHPASRQRFEVSHGFTDVVMFQRVKAVLQNHRSTF